jgi:hypothetical protein
MAARVLAVMLTLALALATGCDRAPPATRPARDGADPNVTTLGTAEVTARLVEVPDGAIVRRELYDYATVLKYEVQAVHRGEVHAKTIYVGHYNPFKPRAEASDRKVKGVGGDVRTFRAGDLHRMALDVPLDDHFMGGIINPYFDVADASPIYWARWTNEVDR